MTSDEYNADQPITGLHLTEMTRLAQYALGLPVDGKCGPHTRAALEAERARRGDGVLGPLRVIDGWLTGDKVTLTKAHPSWYYPRLATPDSKPQAIVAHYSATAHGTADAMAMNRVKRKTIFDRAASWHVSIEGDGRIVQMISLLCGAWHAGGRTAKPIMAVGAANRVAVGIELIGDGTAFPAAQVTAANRVWRALTGAYGITRELAMVTHQELDPTRKRDPGPLWMGTYAERVLDFAYLPKSVTG